MNASHGPTPFSAKTTLVEAKPRRIILILSLILLFVLGSIGVWGLRSSGILGAGSKKPEQKVLQAEGQLSGPPLLMSQDQGSPNLLQSQSAPGPDPTLLASKEQPAPSLLQSQGSNTTPPVLMQSQEAQTPPVLQSTPVTAPPILEAKAPPKIEMPADVREWLEHLRRTEQKREQVANDQVSQAIVMLMTLKGVGDLGAINGLLDDGDEGNARKDPGAPNKVAQDANRMKNEWIRLIQTFNSRKPPASECVAMRNSYDQVLRETGNMIQEIIGIVANVGDNPMAAVGKLQSMIGTSSNRIDTYAQRVDQAVADICKKYETEKWFSIKKDIGDSLVTKLGM